MKKPFIVSIITILVIVVIIAIFAIFAGWRGKPTEIESTPTSEITATPLLTVTPITESTPIAEPTVAPTKRPDINIAHGIVVKYPDEYADMLVHEQEVQEALITETFSMHSVSGDIPLFCIGFGDAEFGEWFGVLNTDVGDIPIVHTVFVLSEDELATMDESVQNQYFALMDCINDVLNTIAADPRFTADKPLAVGEDAEVKTTYWSLTLPSNMTVVETNENDTYVAMFYGEVAGERTALYTVHIGDNKVETELGLFEVDGIKKPISVGGFDLSEKPNWTEDDYSAAYRMMDTINHVIDVITSSEQFSVPSSEEPTPVPEA